MLNASYSYGGPNLAVRTIETQLRIPIKGYVAVNFNAFKQIINAVGGVHIALTGARPNIAGLSQAISLNGSQALRMRAFARLTAIFSEIRGKETL